MQLRYNIVHLERFIEGKIMKTIKVVAAIIVNNDKNVAMANLKTVGNFLVERLNKMKQQKLPL